MRLVSAAPPAPSGSAAAGRLFSQYGLDNAYGEMFEGAGRARPHYGALLEELGSVSPEDLRRRQMEADRAFLTQGITFIVYGDEQGTEHIFPFDLLPRIITSSEWEIYTRFEYRPQSTRVDSPIEEALAARGGVCQDFAHIFIALARRLGIPSRYVSGCLFRDRADRSADDATHAWMEAFLPAPGWIGFDPTNNLIAEERHIRVAIGLDYADVPPTRGVYKGVSAVRSELAVAVHVGPVESTLSGDLLPFTPWMSRDVSAPPANPADVQQQ